jgi:molybdopterin converting factor small subunit
VDGNKELDLAGNTVGEVLQALTDAYPPTRQQLFTDDNELNRYVNIYLGDEDVRVLQGLDTPVKEDDTLVILPAMAGGTETVDDVLIAFEIISRDKNDEGVRYSLDDVAKRFGLE